MEANKTPEIRFKDFNAAWEQRKLGELCTISKGHGYSKADIRDDGTPLILYGRLYTQYESRIENVDTFAVEQEGSLLSKGNEVIVPASGETAEDIAVASSVRRSGIIFGGDLNVVTPASRLDPDYTALAITYSKAHDDLARRAQGKSVVHVHGNDIAEVEVSYPSKSEQKRISTTVLTLDNLITLHQRKCDKLVKLKPAMLNRMFPKPGDFEPEIRFAGFKEPWERYKLGDVAAIARGERFTASDYVESGGIPCIHYGEIYTSYGTIATKTFSQVSSSLKDSLRYAKQGDVIVAATSENVEDVCKAVVWTGNSPVAYHDDSFALTFSGDPIFLVSFFETSEFFAQKSSAAHGVKVMRVSSDSLADVDLPLPSAAEQRLIGGYFAKLDNLITLHRRKIEGLKKIKSAMLDKMFV